MGVDFLRRVDLQGVAERGQDRGQSRGGLDLGAVGGRSADDLAASTPPPARATLNTFGKWSRPALGLIFGVRPNSPIQTTSVRPSMPVLLQVVDQGRQRRVDLLGEVATRGSPGECPSRWSGPRRT